MLDYRYYLAFCILLHCPGPCFLPYVLSSSTPYLSIMIPSALRIEWFFLNDHRSFLVLRITFFRGMRRARKSQSPTSQSCANSKEKQASQHPEGPQDTRGSLSDARGTTTGLHIFLFPSLSLCSCLQLQNRCIKLSHRRLGTGLTVPQRVFRMLAYQWIGGLSPETMLCEILLSKSCGWCPLSHNSTHWAEAHGPLD